MKAAEKLELIEWLAALQDDDILQSVQAIKDSAGTFSLEELPKEEREGIERGLKASEEGQTVSSEQVWSDYEHYLKD